MADMPTTEAGWKKKLTPKQYQVLREKGTEPAFSGKFYRHKENGMYVCLACGTPLFSSETKFESGTGWPSFSEVAEQGNVRLETDTSHDLVRIEVTCATCGGHLGHLFDDGPTERGGKRFCINSCTLDFQAQPK